MYQKKQTNIMRHKNWHTGGIIMKMKVAQAEEKAELEREKAEIREKERAKEREQRYYSELQEKSSGVKRRERVDFMYEFAGARKQPKSGVEMVSADALTAGEPKGDLMAFTKQEPKPKAPKAIAVDLENKIREDPMMMIQQARVHALQEKLNDPMWALAFQQQKKKMQKREEKEEKKAKKEKKDKKDKKEKKRKRRRSSSSSSSRSRSPKRRHSSSTGHHTSSTGGVTSSSSTYRRERRPALTEEEKQSRLRDMEASARTWTSERASRIRGAEARDRQEEAENKTGGAAYMAKVSKELLNSNISDSIHSNKFYSNKDASFKR